MKRMAMIENGVVVNIAEWDGVSTWQPGSQFTLVDITGTLVDIGWTYDGSTFTAAEDES